MPNYNEIFEQSVARVFGNGAYNPEFIGAFYELFLEASPAIAEKFAHTDMSAQRTMLHDSLLLMMDFIAQQLVSDKQHERNTS